MKNSKMNCGYCGKKCNLDKDFCIPQDSVYVCQSCYTWQQKVANLEAKLAEKEAEVEGRKRLNSLRYAQLERQDKEIKELKNELEKYKIKDTVGLAQFINENSIKLAIAELEKVKEYNATRVYSSSLVDRYIDNQIKSLKERKHE